MLGYLNDVILNSTELEQKFQCIGHVSPLLSEASRKISVEIKQVK
jgi:hypothetical protein